MQLACEAVVPGLGCDFVANGESADSVYESMTNHGGEAHANLMDGKTPEEMTQMKAQMDVHIRQLIADNN